MLNFWRKRVLFSLVAFVATQSCDHYKSWYLRKFLYKLCQFNVIVTCRTVRTIADIPIPKPYVLAVSSINDIQPYNIGIGMKLRFIVQTCSQTLVPGYWLRGSTHVVCVVLQWHDEGNVDLSLKKVLFSQSLGPVYPQHEYYRRNKMLKIVTLLMLL